MLERLRLLHLPVVDEGVEEAGAVALVPGAAGGAGAGAAGADWTATGATVGDATTAEDEGFETATLLLGLGDLDETEDDGEFLLPVWAVSMTHVIIAVQCRFRTRSMYTMRVFICTSLLPVYWRRPSG